ncbi:MAG: hypothetical protein VCA36_13665 [Opitutales bacterium]
MDGKIYPLVKRKNMKKATNGGALTQIPEEIGSHLCISFRKTIKNLLDTDESNQGQDHEKDYFQEAVHAG